MKRALTIFTMFIFVGVLAAQAPMPSRSTSVQPNTANARFITCDVLINTGTTPLAAWQVDIRASIAGDGNSVQLVGVEGDSSPGGSSVFAEPPHYDPYALTHDHVVLAAFSLADPKLLPVGSTHVARLHLRVVGDAGVRPEFTTKLITAATADGTTFTPTATTQLGDTK